MKTILFFILVTASIVAQPSKRTFRILYLNAPSSAPDELVLFDGKESQEVQLPRMNFSPVYELRSGVRAVALMNIAPESIREVPREAPRMKIPEDVTDFYIFISPDPDNPVAPVRMNLVSINPNFEPGQMLWFNLTENAIGGKVGEEKIVIKPKSSHLMDAPVKNSSNYAVELDFKPTDKNYLQSICKTQWFHHPDSRNVAFVFSRPGRRAPRAMVFADYRESWKRSESTDN